MKLKKGGGRELIKIKAQCRQHTAAVIFDLKKTWLLFDCIMYITWQEVCGELSRPNVLWLGFFSRLAI